MANPKGNIEHPKFAPRWRSLPTSAVRIPEEFQAVLIDLARQIDSGRIALEDVKQFIAGKDREALADYLQTDDWATEEELSQLTIRQLRELCSRVKNFRLASHAELVSGLAGKVRKSELPEEKQ